MKISFAFALFGFVSCASVGLAAPKTTSVALRSVASKEGRHISVGGRGALLLGSTVISDKEVFNLIDLNGGALQDGDAVQIEFKSNKATYWQDSGALINRTGDKPGAKCLFKVKWKVKNKTLQLRDASGKVVSASQKGQPLAATSKATDPATVFQLIANPKMVKMPAKK